MKKILIVGAGGIGQHLSARLKSQGFHGWITSDRDQLVFKRRWLKSKKPDAVFIAIPTPDWDKGRIAKIYILSCVESGIPVITCEKGALAYHADVLKPHLSKIGFSATVGGGTRMLKYVQGKHLAGRQVKISTVLNGTLNFIFSQMKCGTTLDEACRHAIRLGYAEPGADDPISLINGELRDVLMKTCVFFNTVLAKDEIITPDYFGKFELAADDLESLSEIGKDYRMVVNFSNHPKPQGPQTFGKEFSLHSHDRWHISGGFRQISHTPELYSWLPGGVGNAVNIVDGEFGSGGEYTLSGPGAGREPTTSAMIADFAELCP